MQVFHVELPSVQLYRRFQKFLVNYANDNLHFVAKIIVSTRYVAYYVLKIF